MQCLGQGWVGWVNQGYSRRHWNCCFGALKWVVTCQVSVSMLTAQWVGGVGVLTVNVIAADKQPKGDLAVKCFINECVNVPGVNRVRHVKLLSKAISLETV